MVVEGGGRKIIIGGAPVTTQFTGEIAADGYAADAGETVSLVKRLLGAQPLPTPQPH